MKRLTGRGAEFCSVIKGNAYGHGIETFVPLAESCGVRRFAVFSSGEAFRAHESFTADSTVMIMGEMGDDAVEWAVEKGVSFYVFDEERLLSAIAAASKVGRRARIHLELETGLNRTGFDQAELSQALELIASAPGALTIEGVCTHYAGAESSANFLRIAQQRAQFESMVSSLRRAKVEFALCHTACSAAAINLPETAMDLVRFGIAQYGYWPSQETYMRWAVGREQTGSRSSKDPLRRVIRFESRVMALKRVKRGEFVGYGNVYLTPRSQVLAAVPVGYFHGFARSLSNLGHVLIHGRRAPVVGLVNMNMMMVDVTDLRGVEKGDEVVIIGKQGRAQISIGSFSDLTRYLNYEVLIRLPGELPRVIVD